MAELEQTYEIEVSVDNEYDPGKVIETGEDPFSKDVTDLRAYGGISATLKRKMSREIHKARTPADAASRALNPEYSNYSTAYNIFNVAIPPFNLDYLAQIFEVSSPHMAAVNAKVSNVVGLGYGWVESPKTADALERVSDDQDKVARSRRRLERLKMELNEWLDDCNSEDSFIETLSKVWTDFEATGNGYIEVGRTSRGDIRYVGHIPSTTMRVRIQRDGFVQMVGDKARYFRNFGDKTTSDPVGNDGRPNEIIHIKQYTPTNSYYGVPDIVSARNALAGSEFAARFNLDYFEHKAVPRYVIVISGGKLSEDSERRVLNFFRTNLKGRNHRTLYVPLPTTGTGEQPKFEMKPVEAGVQDASFTEYHKLNLDTILMAHRVPITKVGVASGASVAVAKDADKTFKEQVCGPRQKVLEHKVNKIVKERTDALVLKMNELTLTDAVDQAKIDQIEVNFGITTPNEIRQRQGKPGLKNGSMTYMEQQAKLNPKPTSQQPPAQASANAQPTRQRDGQRAVNAADSTGSRNPKGEGRAQA